MNTEMLSYIKKDSPIHKLTGATKLICFLLWTIAAMITYDTRVLIGLFIAGIIVFKISKIKFEDVSFILYFILFFLLLNANIKEIENQEMPIVYIISNYFNKYKKIYAFIVLASIFTTAISVGIGFLQNISKNSNSYPQFVLFMCITSLLMSNIGFSKLLNFIYPVFGYIGILQIVIIFFIN